MLGIDCNDQFGDSQSLIYQGAGGPAKNVCAPLRAARSILKLKLKLNYLFEITMDSATHDGWN